MNDTDHHKKGASFFTWSCRPTVLSMFGVTDSDCFRATERPMSFVTEEPSGFLHCLVIDGIIVCKRSIDY